jgi:hypothetical protein
MRRTLALSLLAASLPSMGLTIARSSLQTGKSLDYTRELTAIGSRLTGSASYERAAVWAAEAFRGMSIARVEFEPFTIERGWERVSAGARIVAPVERPLHVASLGWMPSTPEGGLEAEVVALDTYALDAIARRSLHDRIVMLPEGDPPGGGDGGTSAARALGAALRAAGALAILVQDSDPDNTLTARGFGFGTVVGVLPAAQIGHDDGQAMRALLAKGPVRIALELTNRLTPAAAVVNNVIAEIRGNERPDEYVVVGAHLDSWDFGVGAQDNATGAAMVIEAARAIAALPRAPKRSVRFALWGGEEQGQVGSTAYARAHASELDRVVAYLNTDAGTGRVIGWTSPGRADVVRAVRPLLRDAFDELHAATFDESLRYAFQSDGAPFILAGVPTLDLNADDARYETIHHKAADTIDRVDARQLAVGAAVVAATAYAVADAPARVAPRLDQRAIERMRRKGDRE